jgi:hypothetical protein
MTELDLESDAFLLLLTDALRAGPGSPSWHEALRRLRAGGVQHADEYKLLVTAREHLESGREYRSIRAGPGFAKRLMEAIDQQESRKGKAPPTATTVAMVSALVMLVVLLVIGYLLFSAAEENPLNNTNRLLVNPVTKVVDMGPLPSDWQKIGQFGVEFDRGGIKIGPVPPGDTSSGGGGGAYWQTPLDATEPFSVTAEFRLYHPDANLIPQLFVTDDPNFDPRNGTTGNELVWSLHSDRVRIIVPGGRAEAETPLVTEKRSNTASIAKIRITIDRDQGSIEMGGKTIWSGSIGLDPAKPRYVGVRFLRVGETKADGGVFEIIQVNTRQK